jgi:hypothetical protein
LLGGNIYANIGTDIRYDRYGDLKKNGSDITLVNNATKEKVDLNSFSVDVRLGITFLF